MAMLPVMLRRDRERWGMCVGEAGWAARDHAPRRRRDQEGEQPPNTDQYEAISEFVG